MKKVFIGLFVLLLLFPARRFAFGQYSTNDRSVTLYSTDDAYIIEHQPDLINGTGTRMIVGKSYPGGMHSQANQGVSWNSLIKFDVSNIPRNAIVSQATLRLAKGQLDSYGGSDFYIHRGLSRDWNESSVKWSNRPTQSSDRINITSQDSAFDSWNVTTVVQNWVNGTNPNYGFVLIGGPGVFTNNASQYGYRNYQNQYYTHETSGTYSDPRLTITYSLPAPSATPRIINPGTIINPNEIFNVRVITIASPQPSPTANPTDRTPPVISNLTYVVRGHDVTFSWLTDEPASSQVWYSSDMRFDHFSQVDNALSLNHTATLTNISPGTYNFRAVSRDINNNYGYSNRSTFTISDDVVVGNEPPENEAMADDPNIAPEFEGMADDADGDGVVDARDWDCNGDGIPNGELDGDFNCDGIPDFEEDIDGDGIVEGEVDIDGDGIPNIEDADDDGDQIIDEQDPDQNGNGVIDAEEDPDGDGIQNQNDPDDDNDGIVDEQDLDANGDGIADNPNQQNQPEQGADDNFLSRLRDLIEDELAKQLIAGRIKSSESGGQGIASFNPFVLASAAFGTNRVVGLVFVFLSLLLLLLAFLALHAGKKTLQKQGKTQERERNKSKPNKE